MAIPFVEDLGSGSLVDLEPWGLPHEPTVAEALAQGADLVTFSGDKLLGGPQAGLVVGRADLVARLAKNPLKRALRLDKIRLAALEAVLRLYADPDRLAERLPALRLLARPKAEIEARRAAACCPPSARAFAGIAEVELVETRSQIGSGALPVSLVAERGLGAASRRPGEIRRRRRGPGARARARLPIPVIGRIEAGNVMLDLRCLEDEAGVSRPARRTRRRAAMILATAGHIDHGKTALVRALTGVDADRLPEEKRRGLTIDLGFAYASLPDGTELGFVDVPGTSAFCPTCWPGVLSIDRVLLVVAADDGPRPQTIEHLDILELIEVAEITGVVTKIDRVPPERAAAVAAEVAELLAEAGYRRQPDLPGVEPHRRRHRRADPASVGKRPLRRAARASDAARGSVSHADRPRLYLARDRARRHRHGRRRHGHGRRPADGQPARRPGAGARVARAEPCDRDRRAPASAAPSTSSARSPRAASRAAATGCWRPSGICRRGGSIWSLRASRHAEAPLRDGLPVHLHLGTEDVVGRVAVLSGRAIDPGETGFVQIDLEQPIGALHGDRAVLRDHAARHDARRRPGRRPVGAAPRAAAAGAARHARRDEPRPTRRRRCDRNARGRRGSSTSRNSRWCAI